MLLVAPPPLQWETPPQGKPPFAEQEPVSAPLFRIGSAGPQRRGCIDPRRPKCGDTAGEETNERQDGRGAGLELCLESALQRLSPDSRHKRFLAPKPRFNSAELRYLTEVDEQAWVDPCHGDAVTQPDPDHRPGLRHLHQRRQTAW